MPDSAECGEGPLQGRTTNERGRIPGTGLRHAGRPGDPRRSASQAHRYPRGLGIPGRHAHVQGQARSALSLPGLFDPRPAQEGVRGGARGQPALRARNLPRRRADHARGRRPARARRRRRTGRMGGRDAPLRRGCDPRPVGGSGPDRCRTGGRTRPRGGGGACNGDRGRRPPLGEGVGRLYRGTRRGLRRDARPVSGGGGRRPRAREPRRLCPHPSAPGRARQPRSGPPHSRRSSSGQHRPARRPPGAVRCHRIQPADRVRRRALRSGVPADGFDRARTETRGEFGAQSLPLCDRTSRRLRRSCNATVLLVDARGHSRQGDGSAAAIGEQPGKRTRSRAMRANTSTLRAS